MTGNSVDKCFAVWNVIQDALLTLNSDIYCFCIKHHYQQAYNLKTGTESLKPYIQLFFPIKKKFFGSNLFQKSQSKDELLRGYLIVRATYLFAIIKIDIK